jgi:hypothetical protein
VYLCRLLGIELCYLGTLGCQMLSIHQLPVKLVKIYKESYNDTSDFREQILFD